MPDLVARLQNTRVILHQTCTEDATGTSLKEEIKDSVPVTTKGKIKIFYANDRIFPLADLLKMIQMIPLFTNGNIALRTEIKIEQGPVAISLTCKAKEIHTIQKGLPDSIFRYPKGHSIQRNEESQKASFFTPIFLLQNP